MGRGLPSSGVPLRPLLAPRRQRGRTSTEALQPYWIRRRKTRPAIDHGAVKAIPETFGADELTSVDLDNYRLPPSYSRRWSNPHTHRVERHAWSRRESVEGPPLREPGISRASPQPSCCRRNKARTSANPRSREAIRRSVEASSASPHVVQSKEGSSCKRCRSHSSS